MSKLRVLGQKNYRGGAPNAPPSLFRVKALLTIETLIWSSHIKYPCFCGFFANVICAFLAQKNNWEIHKKNNPFKTDFFWKTFPLNTDIHLGKFNKFFLRHNTIRAYRNKGGILTSKNIYIVKLHIWNLPIINIWFDLIW